MSDPCSCVTLCPHGDRCFGGHAFDPDSHWFPCTKCTPPTKFEDLPARMQASLKRLRKP